MLPQFKVIKDSNGWPYYRIICHRYKMMKRGPFIKYKVEVLTSCNDKEIWMTTFGNRDFETVDDAQTHIDNNRDNLINTIYLIVDEYTSVERWSPNAIG